MQEVNKLNSELSKLDLQGLSKYDFATIKSELQNKYHAELEILREDYENRIDMLSIEHENKLHDIERKYGEEIDALKYELTEALKLAQNGPVQEVVSVSHHYNSCTYTFSLCFVFVHRVFNACLHYIILLLTRLVLESLKSPKLFRATKDVYKSKLRWRNSISWRISKARYRYSGDSSFSLALSAFS